jgi:beta-barrel assembly-enhancing protease
MKKLTLLALCLALAFPAFPEGLPDLGDNSEATLNLAQERALGQRIMRDIRADRDFIDDAELSTYINNLGGRLVSNSTTPRDDFEFFIVRDPTINAFALPGGYVGVHSGLILAAQSESELASVLAHEVTHVTQRHIARLIAGTSNTALLTSLAMIAAVILAARTNSQTAEAAIATSQGLAIQNQLDYTREHEREADRLGLQVLEKSGFDTRGMASFFDRMQKSTRYSETNAPSYLRTHPLTTERIADIQNRIAKTPNRSVPDGLDFQLARAKLRALQSSPHEAMQYFEGNAAEKTAAQTYGSAVALLRLREFARAEKELAAAKKLASHPMLDNLGAQIKRESGDTDAALEMYRTAIQTTPQNRALAYGYIDTLLAAKQNEQALKLVNEKLGRIQDDYRLFELQARSYAALGKKLPQHQAQAEAYVRQEKLQAAIEQLELGIKTGNGDFYQLSAAESRLKQLKLQFAAEEAENKRTRRQ